MPEKAKQVGITIKRQNRPDAKIVQVTGFKMRQDKATGIVEFHLERRGFRGERVSFDPVIIRSNLADLKRYVTAVTETEDDAALKDEVSVSDADTYSNVIHLCQVSGRCETIFATFRFADWIDATRQDLKARDREIFSHDSLIMISTSGLQKKLVLELLSILDKPLVEL